MAIKKTLLGAFAFVAMLSFSNAQQATTKTTDMQNPFFMDWSNQAYNAPPFEKIKEEHYMPAVDKAIAEHKKEIESIISNKEEPTFENTLLVFDNSGLALEKVLSVLFNIYEANSTPYLRELLPEVAQKVTAHEDEMYMNPFLFRRIKSLKSRESQLGLDLVQKRLLDETYKTFVRRGAELTESKRDRLKEINSIQGELEILFSQNVLQATEAVVVVVNNESELEGLPQDYKQAAKERALGNGNKGWQFGLDNPSIMPCLQYVNNSALREHLLSEYLQRCNKPGDANNVLIINHLVKLRLEKANLLGYADYASYALSDRMAPDAKAVYSLLDKIWVPSLEKAKEELSQMISLSEREGRSKSDFKASDWSYYANKIREEKYSLNEDEIRPYFSMDVVKEGIFALCEEIYGIKFKQTTDVDMPTPNTTAYICYDNNGEVLGLLYLDMVARPGSKSNGAWNTNYVNQRMKDGKRLSPVTSIVANFSAPSADKPSLLNLDETETFFHEFGHALHALFANVKYKGLSDVPRDFVELPSQIMEHWAMAPEMLRKYAKHYESGEIIPDSLINKIVAAAKHGQGFATIEFLAAAYLDMDYHTQTKIKGNVDVDKFENKNLNQNRKLLVEIPPRYRSTYFLHSMGGGYTAGYYSYLWAEVLDCDAFEAFEESGNIFNAELAKSFRKKILENGGMYDAMDMYRDFRGRDADVNPLLRSRGLQKK